MFASVTVRRCVFFFSSRRRHTRFDCDWSSDVCSSDLQRLVGPTPLLTEPMLPAAGALAPDRPLCARTDTSMMPYRLTLLVDCARAGPAAQPVASRARARAMLFFFMVSP